MEMHHANWIAQANEHWKEHQPTRYKRLMQAGELGKALKEAAAQTATEFQALKEQGLDALAAWEMVRERYLFPAEEPGASPAESPSQGYGAMRDLTQTLGSLGMEPDPIRKD
jgi:hypothetical protein